MGDDDRLDDLLANLNQQMGNVKNSAPRERGRCHTCGKGITGELVEASGRSYHLEHFVCQKCRKPLHGVDYYEPDSLPHCEACYHKHYLGGIPFCAKCNERITNGRAVTAMDKSWHPHHFQCAQCNDNLEGKEFFAEKGQPYCVRDYQLLFSHNCQICSKAIQGEQVEANSAHYHPSCFVCAVCRRNLAGSTFYAHGGKVYCEEHYHSVASVVCPCGKPITKGQFVTALGQKWHPEHFVCTHCNKSLVGASYAEVEGKAYCVQCDEKLF